MWLSGFVSDFVRGDFRYDLMLSPAGACNLSSCVVMPLWGVFQARLTDHHAANETRKFRETQRGYVARESKNPPKFREKLSSPLGTTHILNRISRNSGSGQRVSQ